MLVYGRYYKAATGEQTITLPISINNYTIVTSGGRDGYVNANTESDTIGQPYSLTSTTFKHQTYNITGKKWIQYICIGY